MKNDNRKSRAKSRQYLLLVNAVILFLICFGMQPAYGLEAQPQVIRAGDRVRLDIICKESTGEIILTTYPELANDQALRKSTIYQRSHKPEPLRIVAGESRQYSGTDPLKSFNNELSAELSKAIPGMRVGQSASLTFTASVPEGLAAEDRYITLSRARMVPKKMSRPQKHFIINEEQELRAGRALPTAIGMTATITSVKGEDVDVEFIGKEGDKIETPWGIGVLRDHGENWRLELDVHVGRLVRTGHYVGRISSVEEDRYIVDFGFPFGHESIVCEISVVGIMGQEDVNE